MRTVNPCRPQSGATFAIGPDGAVYDRQTMPADSSEPESATQDELEAEAPDAEAGAEVDLPTPPPVSTRRPPPSAILIGVAALLIGAALALTALMLWQHRTVSAQRAADERFVEAARTGVTALLTIDHSHAKDDVARILDLSTGSFRDDFARRADDFIQTAEKSKAVTKGSISAAALESAEPDTAVVLVAAASQVTNLSGAKEDPRPWRMSVTVTRDGDKVKMSDVEFVP